MIKTLLPFLLINFLISKIAAQHILSETFFEDKKVIWYTEKNCEAFKLPPSSEDSVYSCAITGNKVLTVKTAPFGGAFSSGGGYISIDGDKVLIHEGDHFGGRNIFQTDGKDLFKKLVFSDTLERINSIAFDTNDHYYLGTSKGLLDSRNGKMYNFSNSKFLYTSAENIKHFDNKIWYSSNDLGYGYLDLEKDTFINFGFNDPAGRYINSPRFVEDPYSKALYITPVINHQNYCIYKNGEVKNYHPIDYRISYLGTDKNSDLWGAVEYKRISGSDTYISTSDLYKFVGDTVEAWNSFYPNFPNVSGLSAFCWIGDSLFVAFKGTYYNKKGGLYLFDGTSWDSLSISNSWLPSDIVIDMKKKGDTLVLLFPNGVSFLHLKGNGSITSMQSNAIDHQIAIYPNPVSDHFSILGSTVEKGYLLNLQGVVLTSFSAKQELIDLTNLSSGSYLLKCILKDGAVLYRKITKI